KEEGLTGKALRVIGVGNIGRELLVLAQPFAMRLLACDPYATPEALAGLGVELVDRGRLLAESDFVCVCVPLNDETRHMIGAEELRLMKPSAYLVNTSRGSVVDEPALIEALRQGTIRGAGLDVFEQEPVDPDNPLLRMENVVVSPHSLCHTDEYYTTAWSGKLEQAREIMAGKIPAALVNREVLDREDFQAKLARIRR
ncbi:MAG: dehydrogenase, partial [Gemmatimonadetes bacterium]|nr:dehydrogenase [Gemmatimonadota bacterium]